MKRKLFYIAEDYVQTVSYSNVGVFLRYFQSLSLECCVLTTSNEDNRDTNEVLSGICLYKLGVRLRSFLPRLFLHLMKTGSKGDIVFAYVGRWNIYPLLFVKLFKPIKIVLKADSILYGKDDDRGLWQQMFKFWINSVDVLLVESPRVYNYYSTLIPKNTKMVLMPNGITSGHMLFKQSKSICYKQNVILCVGRKYSIKGQDVLIRAFKQISDQCIGWRLRLIGPRTDQDFVEEIRVLAKDLGIEERVEEVEAKFGDSLYDEYMSAAIYCLPSRSEGMPNVIPEAMYFENCIVATNVGEVSYLLDDGNAGAIVPPANVNALAEALLKVIRDVRYRECLVNNALSRIQSKFMWEQNLKQLDHWIRFE